MHIQAPDNGGCYSQDLVMTYQNSSPIGASDIIVTPDDDLQEAIDDAGSTPIRLRQGTYRGGFKLRDGTQLLAYPGEKPVLMGAEPVPVSAWTKDGDAYSIPWQIPFYQHPSHQVGQGEAGLRHRAAMQPHMIVVDGMPLQTVYSNRDLVPGTMYLEGVADEPRRLWVRFMDDRPPAEFEVLAARHQRILYADRKGTEGVVLEGLTLRYCANTAYQGMIDFPEDAAGWRLSNIDAQWSNTEGLHIIGRDHQLHGIVTNNHGQNGLSSRYMQRCLLEDIETSFNNWKGFDPKWDAGNKLRNSNDNTLRRIKAVGNPIWWDIWNQGNWMEDFEILDSICWGLMVEHHSGNNSFVNGLIRDTRRYNGEDQTGSGLRIQGSIIGCEFVNVRLEENEGGAVYYKKTENRGGEVNFSGLNTFDGISQRGNGRAGRWVIEGDPDKFPDRFRNMEKPALEVRR